MPNEEEVLWYKLDITDAEAKAVKLQQIVEEIKAKKAAGQDVSELEAQFHKEADGLSKVTHEQKKASTATEDLTRQKDKLANTVQLLGGQFGGMIGQLGGVVELLASGGPAAIGLGAGPGALAVGVRVFEDLKRAAEEFAAAQEKANEAVHRGQQAKLGAAEQIGGVLGRFGAGTPENVQAATRMYDQLRKTYGVRDEELAAMASLAGATPEAAAVLGVMGRRGVAFGSAEQMQQALAQARKEGTYGELVGEAREWAKTPTGIDVVTEALMPGARGTAERRPEDIAYEKLKARGLIGEDVGREEYQNAQRRLAELRTKRKVWGAEEAERLQEIVVSQTGYETLVRQIAAAQAGGQFGAATPPAATPGSAAAAQTITHIQQQFNAGHITMGPDNRPPKHPMSRMGVSKQDHRKPP